MINRKIILIVILTINTISLMAQDIIYNFKSNNDVKKWFIVNDDVMGGISNSNFKINNNGDGVFQGYI